MAKKQKFPTKALHLARRLAIKELKSKGIHFLTAPTNPDLAAALLKHLEMPAEEPISRKAVARRIVELVVQLGLMEMPVSTKKQSRKKRRVINACISEADCKAFYQSFEWKRIRYEVLADNDGRCELCGVSKHDGAVLNVDHIKCLRFNWSLRLKKSNLQVLCGTCNHGKGSKYDHDWRERTPEGEPRLSVLMGETI